MKLRDYQKYALGLIIKELKSKNKALAYMSVGSGKTIVMAEICRLAKGNILITVPRISLINQTVEKLKLVTDDIGIYCASMNKKELDNQFIVSTLQSINKVECSFKTIIIDEVHLMEKSIDKMVNNIKHNYLLGMSGTPWDLYGTDSFWDKPCIKITIKDLTELNYLTKLVIKDTKNKVDLTGVKIQAGDYALSPLFKKYKEVIVSQVKEALARTESRKAVLWMCVNIEHAEHVFRLLPQNKSAIIHSKLNDVPEKIEMFRDGKIKHLVSVAQISVGFDAPVADTLVLMRATKSPVLFVQTVGRILRMDDDKKDALLLDYGRVIENLGHPYGIIDSGTTGKTNITHLCFNCDSCIPNGHKLCPVCGQKILTKCQVCGELKPLGESCSNGCKVVRDPFKKLTETAYDGKEKKYIVDSFDIYLHKSYSGNECLRFDFINNLKSIHQEFCVISPGNYFHENKLKLLVETFTNENLDIGFKRFYEKIKLRTIRKKRVKGLILARAGKYKDILEVEYD